MIDAASRPRLAPRARLRFDPRSGKHMLLYPERGLELTDQAARIVDLMIDSGADAATASATASGTASGAVVGAASGAEPLSVADIVDRLAAQYGAEPRTRIETEVLAFLRALDDRGLLTGGTP